MNVHDFMNMTSNFVISNAIAKTWDVLGRFQRPVCSISGGSDSDIILDIVHRLDDEHKVRYVTFETGLEYKATREHLIFLEERYNIKIHRIMPVMTIPQAVRKYGFPFVSKHAARFIEVLQQHNFDFQERSIQEDSLLFPNMPVSALRWWHNSYKSHVHQIDYTPALKPFLIERGRDITFRISNRCCNATKIHAIKHLMAYNMADLSIIGTRSAESGIRGVSTRECFTQAKSADFATLRPIFYFTKADKAEYNETFNILNSKCYSVYGLHRTGCIGCPFNPHADEELNTVEQFEPSITSVARKLFAPSLALTSEYQAFKRNLFASKRYEKANPSNPSQRTLQKLW